MAYKEKTQTLLFVINKGSGNKDLNYSQTITSFFEGTQTSVALLELAEDFSVKEVKKAIDDHKPDGVIAVGGDGTLKLVAECVVNTDIPLGIIPAGSANGMAKELEIPLEIEDALAVAASGHTKKIHAIAVNDELCIHLADIGFNAYLVKKFDELPQRGMWTYAKAAWTAFWYHRKMNIEMTMNGNTIKSEAAMIVIANATKYGTGFEINPDGKLDDELFEVILIKEYAVMEILKIWISKLPWNPEKIESFQTSAISITTKRKGHFQVDGEFMGKTNKVTATLLPAAIRMIVPSS